MYESFYGFRERPFDLTANPKYLLLTPAHQEALSSLEYGIFSGNGMTLLLGEAGTGKTTLIREVLTAHTRRTGDQRQTCNPARWAYVSNPRLTSHELLDVLGHAFQLTSAAAGSKSTFLRELERNLRGQRAKGVYSVLVADEAQSLPDELLEEVRLLTNIETETEKLLPVVLAGQPEFGERLNTQRFRQLKQRIGLRCSLPALDLRATAAYIAHRIVLAGGIAAQAFSREAVIAIFERSQGIPRIVNVICDNALLTGFAADQRPVGAEMVLEVCRDLDLQTANALPATAARVPNPAVTAKGIVPASTADRVIAADERGVPTSLIGRLLSIAENGR